MKKKVIIALGLLMVCMSSCVYSLFPIYTDDTLVYLPELVGKWQSEDEGDGDYLEFKSKFGSKDKFNVAIGLDSTKIGGTAFGQKEYDIEELLKRFKAPDSITDGKDGKTANFSNLGTLSADKMNYSMTVYEDGKAKEKYEVHLVRIGSDIFMDLYPFESFHIEKVSENHFPVHTFMKIQVRENEFDMTMFDLEKLNKLFDSNLIRMRHENVDGTILITAQTKEIQKFLSKYSDDESVFDETATYSRIGQ